MKQTEKEDETHKSVVESGGENELAIGGEFGEGDSRGLIFDEGLQEIAGFGVPNLAGAVVAGGDDEVSVAVVVDGGDGHGVALYSVDAFPGLHIPNLNGLVEGTRDNVAGLGVEVYAENDVVVAAEDLDAVAAGGVPDAEGVVVGGGADVVGVGGPG